MKKSSSRFLTLFYTLMIFFLVSFRVAGGEMNTAYLFRFSDNVPGNAFMLLGLYWFCQKCLPAFRIRRSRMFYFLSFLVSGVFSFISVLAVYFHADASLGKVLRSHPLNLPVTIVAFFAGMVTYFAVIQLIGALPKEFPCAVLQKINHLLFEKGIFWKSLLVMLVVWLPQILYSYPGVLTVDTINSLEQYWGFEAATTQHPIFYTMFAGKLMELGLELGNSSLGLVFIVVIQTTCMLLVLAYTLHTMKHFHAPVWLLALTLVFFTFSPIFCSYAYTAIIDTFYGTFFLLFMDELVYYLFEQKEFRRKPHHYLLTAVGALGLYVRHNGLYILLAVIFFAVIMEAYRLVKKETKLRFSILFLLVLLLATFEGKSLSSLMFQQLDATSSSARAMLAMPIQQTARCYAFHRGSIEPEITEDIQRVLTWDVSEYKERYHPLTFDTVKRSFDPDASPEDIKAFLRGWFKLVKKYPAVCLSATLNQTYFLFSPVIPNQKYYQTPKNRYIEIEGLDLSRLNQECAAAAQRTSGMLNRYYVFGLLPGIGLLVNQGFTDLVLFAIALYALLQKNGRILFLCVPLFVTLAIVFVGPMVSGNCRYTFPIMYSLPLLTGIFISNLKPLSR